MTRVFEDLDLPGEGQPFRIVADLTLVDAVTKAEVREAYYGAKTIVGSRRLPIDGNPAQWHLFTGRAEWRLDIPPNSEIIYNGSPGGTLWRRTIQSQSHGTRRNKVKKSTAYIEVPLSLDVLLFPDLVVSEDAVVADYTWRLTQKDDWSKTLTVSGDEDVSGYTFELELRRQPGASVVAEVEFDYSLLASEGTVGMHLPGSVTEGLIGTYVGKLQQYDSDGHRSTRATWAFVVERDA